jgi:hypothetical protein
MLAWKEKDMGWRVAGAEEKCVKGHWHDGSIKRRGQQEERWGGATSWCRVVGKGVQVDRWDVRGGCLVEVGSCAIVCALPKWKFDIFVTRHTQRDADDANPSAHHHNMLSLSERIPNLSNFSRRIHWCSWRLRISIVSLHNGHYISVNDFSPFFDTTWHGRRVGGVIAHMWHSQKPSSQLMVDSSCMDDQ